MASDRPEDIEPTFDEIRRVATAICKSKTCEGFRCCQWPASGGRTHCPVAQGGYDNAAKDAIAAMLAARPSPAPGGTEGWQRFPSDGTCPVDPDTMILVRKTGDSGDGHKWRAGNLASHAADPNVWPPSFRYEYRIAASPAPSPAERGGEEPYNECMRLVTDIAKATDNIDVIGAGLKMVHAIAEAKRASSIRREG